MPCGTRKCRRHAHRSGRSASPMRTPKGARRRLHLQVPRLRANGRTPHNRYPQATDCNWRPTDHQQQPRAPKTVGYYVCPPKGSSATTASPTGIGLANCPEGLSAWRSSIRLHRIAGRLATCPRGDMKRAPNGPKGPGRARLSSEEETFTATQHRRTRRPRRAVTPKGSNSSVPSVPSDNRARPRHTPRGAMGPHSEAYTRPRRSSGVHALRVRRVIECRGVASPEGSASPDPPECPKAPGWAAALALRYGALCKHSTVRRLHEHLTMRPDGLSRCPHRGARGRFGRGCAPPRRSPVAVTISPEGERSRITDAAQVGCVASPAHAPPRGCGCRRRRSRVNTQHLAMSAREAPGTEVGITSPRKTRRSTVRPRPPRGVGSVGVGKPEGPPLPGG